MSLSATQHQFSMAPSVGMERSVFDRSFTYKTTFDESFLIPFLVEEVLPGDTFHVNAQFFARLLTPLKYPIMDNMYLDTHYFEVPYRLLWSKFKQFMGELANPYDPDNPPEELLLPQAIVSVDPETMWSSTAGKLNNYFGIPASATGGGTTVRVNAMPFRAYNLIWNEWFRDQNQQDSIPVPTGDGPDNPGSYVLLHRGKRHDYFTSALPWPQKGPGVELPLGTSAPVIGNGKAIEFTNGFDPAGNRYNIFGTNTPGNGTILLSEPGSGVIPGTGETITHTNITPTNAALGIPKNPNLTGMVADLKSAIGPTINSFREAMQLQRMYERDARGGTRYTEIIRSHFHVVSPDARQQRPIYLGGSSQRIQIQTIPQTSQTTAGAGGSPQANLAAFGVVSSFDNGFSASFTEHSIIIGLLSVRADLTYQQGLHRMWSRRTKVDHYWPVLAHLGEQEILNKEIYFQNDELGANEDNAVFGYQERYAEYRYKPNMVTGLLQTDSGSGLDSWHLAQYYTAKPQLGPTFIAESENVSRVVAVQNQPHFILDSRINMKCARPMPTYSIPGLVDHF